MQLSGCARVAVLALGLCAGGGFAFHGSVRAEAKLGLGTTYFHESGGPLHMNVIIPAAEASVDLGEPVTLGVGWSADIVSGASVAVVDAPAAEVDAISTATVTDTRHEFSGTISIRDDIATFDLGYSHALEQDYLSNAFSVGARTELFDRNTVLQVGYGRGFDEVCDVAGTFDAVMKPRLDSSDGCFEGGPERTERELSVHTFQAGWTQAWTPILTMQLTATAQLLHGFQANPYRAVRIGKTAAQEHHPRDRARYALAAGLRFWIAPLSGALQAETRVYRDTWDVLSMRGELAYEQSIAGSIRLRLRGRYYTQSSAAFYSDDYVLAPQGRYFTGDRELSDMQSALLGGRLAWNVVPDDAGVVFGFLSGFELGIQADLLETFFDDFHYDRAEVPNTTAWIGGLELHAVF